MGCDLSGATAGVGVCNKVACGAVGTGGSGGSSGMSCPSVVGAYTLSLDLAKSSTQCKSAFTGNNACSISQTGCTVSWACSGAGFSDLTLDSDGRGTTTVPTPGGTANCNVKFYSGPPKSLSFDCSLTVSGQVVVCSGTGQ